MITRLRRLGITAGPFANAIAPALLVAQAVGRLGNYFNKELFGKPTTLPWGVQIPYQYRVTGGIPAQDLHFASFQPTFLYELIWDLALAAFLVWLGHHAKIKPWGLFALYVAGYSAFRIFEESVRIDSSEYFPRAAAEHVHRHPCDAGRPAVVRVRAAPARPACRHTPRHRQPGTGHSAGLRGATRARSEELEEVERRAISLSARVPSTAPVTPTSRTACALSADKGNRR